MSSQGFVQSANIQSLTMDFMVQEFDNLFP